MLPLNDEKTLRILRRALTHYGEESQTRMLFEEMAELQNAICKRARGRALLRDVVTEIADVMVMCQQMALLYGYDAVMEEYHVKITRLALRLENGG